MARVFLNRRLACLPLGLAGITLLQRYYGRIRLPVCLLRLLAVFGLVAAYRLIRQNIQALPSSSGIPLTSCRGLRPRERQPTLASIALVNMVFPLNS